MQDLTRVCLPVYFNEPLSALQRTAEDLEYSELLDAVRMFAWFELLISTDQVVPARKPAISLTFWLVSGSKLRKSLETYSSQHADWVQTPPRADYLHGDSNTAPMPIQLGLFSADMGLITTKQRHTGWERGEDCFGLF